MTRDPFAAARNAVSNASRRPVSDVEIGTVLASGTGAGHVVRALFGDCALDTLLDMGRRTGLSVERLLVAYRTARTVHGAAHEGLNALQADVAGSDDAQADPR